MLTRTIVTLAAKRGSILGLCLSGFPAFAENDGMGAYLHLRQPRPLTFVTLAAKRGPFLAFILGFQGSNH